MGFTFSTKNPLTLPFVPFSTSLAQITNKPATGALEIQVFDPLSVYPSLVLTAVVSIEDGSEPWLGSVKPYTHSVSSLLFDAFEPGYIHETTDQFSLGESGEILLLLLLCSKLVDWVHDH